MIYFVYSIEKNVGDKWITENRFFMNEVNLNNYSLMDVKDKRRNAKYLGMIDIDKFTADMSKLIKL